MPGAGPAADLPGRIVREMVAFRPETARAASLFGTPNGPVRRAAGRAQRQGAVAVRRCLVHLPFGDDTGYRAPPCWRRRRQGTDASAEGGPKGRSPGAGGGYRARSNVGRNRLVSYSEAGNTDGIGDGMQDGADGAVMLSSRELGRHSLRV